MPNQPPPTRVNASWHFYTQVARGILADRWQRRMLMLALCTFLIAAMILGAWPLSEWLASTLLGFAAYWLCVGLFTILLILFALFDLLATIREEKNKHLAELKNELEALHRHQPLDPTPKSHNTNHNKPTQDSSRPPSSSYPDGSSED